MTSFLRRACFITACLGACASPGAAAELRPSWECLPEETAVMIRMPQGAEFVEMLRSRTKFGAVLLGQRRVDKAWALLIDRLGKAGTGEQFRGLDEAMARYGLEADDMRNAFAGDAGLAVVVQPRQEGMKPFLMMLGWLEPGPETAERMLAAVKQKLDEDAAKNGDQAARRIDMEVAGRDVVWTVAPVMQLDIDASDLELEDAGEAGPDGGLERRMEEIRRRIETAKPVQTGQAHAFITRIGGRLLSKAAPRRRAHWSRGSWPPTPSRGTRRWLRGSTPRESGTFCPAGCRSSTWSSIRGCSSRPTRPTTTRC